MTTKRVLLFAPYGAWAVHHQLDAVVGAALRLRGAEVLALTCDGVFRDCIAARPGPPEQACAGCARSGAGLFAAFSLPSLALGQILTDSDRADAERWAGALTSDELTTAEFEGVPVARFVQSTLHAYFLVGHLDLSDPRVSRVARSYLSNAALIVRGFRRLLMVYRPDHVMCFNGVHAYYRVLFELCRAEGIPVVVHERSLTADGFYLLPNHNNFDHGAWHAAWEPWATLPLSRQQCEGVRAYFDGRERGQNMAGGRIYDFATDPASARRQLRLPEGRPIVGVFTSSDWEVGISRSQIESTFATQADWIRETARVCRDRGWYLVVRHHPNNARPATRCSRFLEQMIQLGRELPDHVRVLMPSEQVTSYGLIWSVDVAISYITTMGAEAAIRGVPSVCVARSFFSAMGMDWVRRPQDYGATLVQALERPRPERLTRLRQAYRFAHHAYVRQSSVPTTFGISAAQGVDVRITSVDELVPGRDPIVDAVCGHVLDGKPLLAPTRDELDRSEAEESTFLDEELGRLDARRRQARVSNSTAAATQVLVCAPPGQAWNAALARSRHRDLTRVTVPSAPGSDLAARLLQLAKLVLEASSELVYVGDDAVLLDESVLATSVDLLADPAAANAPAVRWGAWLCDSSGAIVDELATGEVESYDRMCERVPALADGLPTLAYVVARRGALAAWLARWIPIALSSPTGAARQIYDTVFRDEACVRVGKPLLVVTAAQAARASLPLVRAAG